MKAPSTRRWIVAAAAPAVLGLVSSCGSAGSSADPTVSSSTTTPYGQMDPCLEGEKTCFDPTQALAYCSVLQVRQAVLAGKITPAQLPEWADRTPAADGAPMIVNFRDPDGTSTDRRLDQLDAALAKHGFTIDNRKATECSERLTPDNYQETLEKSEGGPPASQ